VLTLSDLREDLGLPADLALSPAKRRALVTRLGNRVMDEINRVTAVTPGALTALVLLTHPRRGLPHEDLIDRAQKLLGVLRRLDARVAPSLLTGSGTLRPEALREAVQMFIDAGYLEAHVASELDGERKSRAGAARDGAIYSVVDGKRLLLDTSKNIIVHFFVERALVAIAMLVPPGPPVGIATVRDRVQKLSRLFKYEFRFRADAPFDPIFEATISTMAQDGKLEQNGEHVSAGRGADGWSGIEWLRTYAAIVQNFLEGYRVAARGLGALVKGPLADKDLVKRALASGNRMFYAGEIERREAVSKPLLQNAYQALLDQGYLERRDGKLALAESFRTGRAVKAIEGRVAFYLGEVSE
jgi:glycerol-3-phosphate O-acyltransferase